MDSRVEMWLEDADELGILIMSISEYFLLTSFLCVVANYRSSECFATRFN